MDRKINVAIYTEGFYTGGTERQLIELIKRLDRECFSVHVLSSRPGGQMSEDLSQVGIKIKYFPLTSLHDFNALRQLLQLRRYLAVNKIDVLHTFSITGNTFGVMAG